MSNKKENNLNDFLYDGGVSNSGSKIPENPFKKQGASSGGGNAAKMAQMQKAKDQQLAMFK